MNIEITPRKSEGTERLLEVSVPVETVREAEDRAATRYASRVRLPGFRQGKAPAGMVKRRFADAIRQEALEALVRDAAQEVMEREQIKLAGQPHVHHVHFDEGKPLTFELHLEVRPEVRLDRTEGFRVTRPPAVVTDDDVARQIEELREQRAALSPVDDRPLPGDMVTVLLATAEEDGTIPEGREYRITLGDGQAISGVEEVIMEVKAGETVERPVKWPDDFPDEAQRGQTKMVRVELQEVKRRELPPLDDAFAREVGDFDSLEALRKAINEDLSRHSAHTADAEVRHKLVDEIIGANPFDVPPTWVAQLVKAYADAYQVPEEEHERFAGEFRSMAERQVRRDLVVDTLAEREGLIATEKEIDDRVAEVASKRNADVGQVYASLQKSGRLKEVERSITEDKVFNWLLERNTVE